MEFMRILPKEASQFDILLYQMVYMPLVCSTLTNDIKRLKAKFTYGYRPGAPVINVFICNKHGEENSVYDENRRI
jgi:hypothetical protein